MFILKKTLKKSNCRLESHNAVTSSDTAAVFLSFQVRLWKVLFHQWNFDSSIYAKLS